MVKFMRYLHASNNPLSLPVSGAPAWLAEKAVVIVVLVIKPTMALMLLETFLRGREGYK
jgi:hypothetical protein